MLFDRQFPRIFVDVESPPVSVTERTDIVLSPAFYWVKRVTLPVRYLREVKRLIPSLFEEMLPPGNYSYTAQKTGDAYLIYAYNDQWILNTLAQKGIIASHINRIFFAQNEFEEMESPMQIGESSVLALNEGIVVKLPVALVETVDPLVMANHAQSGDRVDLDRYKHIADPGSLLWIAGLILCLIILFGTELLLVNQKTARLEQEQGKVFETYHLKPTSMQNEAVLGRLEKSFKAQQALRHVFKQLLALPLKQNEKIALLQADGSGVKAKLHSVTKDRARELKQHLGQSGMQISDRFEKSEWIVEVKL